MSIVENIDDIKKEEMIKAAYALNLCTVSVSQIIDYDDFNILDQEYDVILNNLNLEEMPKDEALLRVIKQLLDTITYFRIDEIERKQVEEEYQSEMQNAIWNSVPSMGLLFVGANPATIIASLASQVGISYINYRRNKANAIRNKEKSLWQLQKSAIEQFNGLRRELFDTAWRLADTYAFPDSYRLTENQIKQYNAILMDTDLIRRYERLETIENCFEAYPPFWYFLGHTAAEIYFSRAINISDSDRQFYYGRAKNFYQKFYDSRKYNLLRVNHIAAAGALEYSDLLDKRSDKEFIKELISYAVDKSGYANDILELCAMSYLGIDEKEGAASLFNVLVNEGYNVKVNAQLLSNLYARLLFGNPNDLNIIRKYNLLSQRVNKQYLYQLPVKAQTTSDIRTLESDFISSQKEVAKKEYEALINHYIDYYNWEFNRIIPLPSDAQDPEVVSYLYTFDGTGDRINEARTWLLNDHNSNDYKTQLCSVNYAAEIIRILNDIFTDLQDFSFINNTERETLWQIVRNKLSENGGKVNDIIESFHTEYRFTIDHYLQLESVTLETFTGEMFDKLSEYVSTYIDNLMSMSEISDFEFTLQRFCSKHGFTNPEVMIEYPSSTELIVDSDTFTVEMLGNRATNENEKFQIIASMLEVINSHQQYILSKEGQKGGASFLMKNTLRFDKFFAENHLNKGRSNHSYDALAVIDDKFALNQDLILTSQMVKIVSFGKISGAARYDKISLSADRKKLKIGNKQYSNKNVNIDGLWILIKELRELSKPLDQLKATTISSASYRGIIPVKKMYWTK